MASSVWARLGPGSDAGLIHLILQPWNPLPLSHGLAVLRAFPLAPTHHALYSFPPLKI